MINVRSSRNSWLMISYDTARLPNSALSHQDCARPQFWVVAAYFQWRVSKVPMTKVSLHIIGAFDDGKPGGADDSEVKDVVP